MNAGAAAQVGVYLLFKGGPGVVEDAITLVRAYRDFSANKTTLPSLLTEANLAAFDRVGKVLVQAAQDPSERAKLDILAASL